MIHLGSAIVLMITVLIFFGAQLTANLMITSVNGNVILGVTLPREALKNEAVADIVKNFRKASSSVLLIFFTLSIPVVFVSGFVSISFAYILMWAIGLIYTNQKIISKFWNKLYLLKKENQWWVGNRNIISIDTEVSRLKNTFPVSKVWFIIPLIISFIPLVNSFFADIQKISWLSICGIITSSFLFLYHIIYSKAKAVVYSENTDVNITLNCVYKREWTKCLVILALVSSIFFTASSFLFLVIHFEMQTLIVIVIFACISVLIPITYAYNKIRNTRNKMISLIDEDMCTDDDEFWVFGAMYYNNPNDKRMMVERRVGGVGFTFNLAKTSSKIIMTSISGIIVGWVIWMFIIIFENT